MSQFFRTPWTFASAVVVLAVLTACSKTEQAAAPPAADKAAPAPAAAAIAVVNGTSITRSEFDVYVKSLLQGKQQELTPEQKNQVLDDLINTQVLADQALKDGSDKDPEIEARLNVLRLRVLADAEVQKYLKAHEPTDAELHAEYDNQVASMDKTEYHARHILLASKDKDLAEQLIKKIKHGAKFEDIAKSQSIDNGSKANGGDLGWFSTSRMVKPFADAVKGLKKGELTPEPVQTQYGWHIIELEDTRPFTPPTFDQFNKQQLINPIMQKRLQAYIDSLKKDAKIEKKM
jgi:peptidyl-prolyl cis-trans isomerase C